jgi:hypothetical protein
LKRFRKSLESVATWPTAISERVYPSSGSLTGQRLRKLIARPKEQLVTGSAGTFLMTPLLVRNSAPREILVSGAG